MYSEIEKIGQFQIENGVYISDPGYDIGTWCQLHLDKGVVALGTYNAFIRRDTSDNRVALLECIKDDFPLNAIKWQNYFNWVCVDSGQAGIFDDKYYKPGDESWYDMVWDVLYKQHHGTGITVDGHGVNSLTGYGDDVYRMDSIISDGHIYGIRIIFIPDVIQNRKDSL